MHDKFDVKIRDGDSESLGGSSPRATRLYSSGSSTDSGIVITPRLDSLINKLPEKEKLTFHSCEWPTYSADLLVKINESLFPVHRMILWRNSELFKSILSSITAIESEDFDMITLHGVSACDMEEILPFFYDFSQEIDEINVLDVLRIASFFEARDIIKRCEYVLIEADETHPIDLLKIAKEYELTMLEETAMNRASKLPKIDRYMDFQDLDTEIKDKILDRIVKRYKGKSQFS